MANGKKSLIALAGALLIAGGVGAAYGFGGHGQGHGGWRMHGGNHAGPMMRMLVRADADRNGEITRGELKTVRDARFAKADGNGDGIVEKAELENAIREHFKERIERMAAKLTRRFDRDRDGRVTKDEFDRLAEERFYWHDLNDDGKIAGDEMPHRMRRELMRRRGMSEQ